MASRYLSWCLMLACMAVSAQSLGLDSLKRVDKIEVKADNYSGSLVKGDVVGKGNVRVTAGDTTLTADKVSVNLQSGEFQAEGTPVKIVLKTGETALEWSGTVISGNLKTKVFNVGTYYAFMKPWYITAESSDVSEDGTVTFKKGKFSTCEQLMNDDPFAPWYLRVSEIKIEREETKGSNGEVEVEEWITIKHPVLQIYGVPVFYWPWAMFQKDWLESIRIHQGQESDWGWYVQISYKTTLIKKLWDAKFQLEYYTKRGAGVEMENVIDNRDDVYSNLLLYYLYDRDPLSDRVIGGVSYNAGNEIPDNRYRLRNFTKWSVNDTVTYRHKVAYLSDPDLMYEYREREYNIDPEPNTYLDISYLQQLVEVSINGTPQVNPFFTTLEKRPEIRVDLPRQELWGSGLYYQSQNSIADLKMSFREYDYDLAPSNTDYSSVRFDSTHMFYTPVKAGWLNILPRAGFRFTWYDTSSAGAVTDADLQNLLQSNARRNGYGTTAPVQYDANGGEISRVLAEVGLELNFKATADWDFRSALFDMDGIQHTVVPFINYILIPEEGEGDREHIYFFDDADRLGEVNMVRAGIDQYFRTHRGLGPDRRSEVFFRMNNYFDYYFDPEDGLEREGDFGTELEFLPAKWAAFDTLLLYDSHDLDLNSLRSHARLGTTYKISATYFFRNDYTERYNTSFGSDLTRHFGTGFFPLTYTENHSITTSLTVPVGKKNTVYYSLSRDLTNKETSSRRVAWKRKVNCWSFALAVSQTVTAKTVELSLFLTDHPKAQLGYSYDYETVED